MVKLKNLTLENYCGYRNTHLDFTDSLNKPKNLSCFFGPNGCGKSTILAAIDIVSSAARLFGRDNEMLFRKMTYHPDYEPSYEDFQKTVSKLKIEAIFDIDGDDKEVIIDSSGIVKCELPDAQKSYCYFIDADHPMAINAFQLHAEMEDIFIDIAKTAYGYDCYLDKKINDLNSKKELFYTDFVIIKPDSTHVHYRRMSGGEKKIATLLRHLCNPLYINSFDMITIDNIEKEVYMSRHAPMVDKLLEIFSDKQFFIATHSPILVGMSDIVRGIEIPPYLDKNALYPISDLK